MSGAGNAPSEAVRRGSVVRVEVRGLSSSGAGVVDLPDGRVGFVNLTAPGDTADVRLDRVKARWATGTLERLVAESSVRVEPPCPLFGTCGGCTLQHVRYEEEVRWKGRFVADALTRIGKREVEPPQVEPSPDAYEYRSRITPTLRRLRGGRVVAGFHALDRPGRIVDMRDECLLPVPAVREAWTALRDAWGSGARLLPPDGELRITVRVTDGGVAVEVHGGAAGWDRHPLQEALPDGIEVWHRPDEPDRSAPDSDDGGLADAEAEGTFAFAQVNPRAAEALLDHVLARAAGFERVVDAYCGTGAYALPLAHAGARVTGIERDGGACAALDAAGGVEVVRGRVEDRLGGTLPADLLIVNPPRTGLEDGVPDTIRRAGVPRVIYVSCDPATLARDLARLGDEYALTDLRCFDLFPQTAHVETVAVLERRP